MTTDKTNKKLFTTENITIIAILTAISFLLYMLPRLLPIFNLPFFPPWLDLQISDLPALLAGFAIGPQASAIIIIVKCLIKLPFTSSFGVGELADIIVGLAFVLPSAIMYKNGKTRKRAILGLIIGSLSAMALSVLFNRLVLIPFYSYTFGNGNTVLGFEKIVSAVSTLYNGVNTSNFYWYYLLLGVLPFNFMRCFACSVITYFIYKPLSHVLHWERKSN